MAERTRKLHVTFPSPFTIATVKVCRYDDAGAGEQLVSSTDGVVAVEVFRQAHERAAHWRVLATHKLEAGELWTCEALARAAFGALGEPDVYAIHVAMDLSVSATFVRDRADWLAHPRPPHAVYSVAPRA